MDLATVLSVVQTIISGVQTLDQLKATFSFSKYKDDFERLGKTVSIIKSVLEDADAKQGALSCQQKIYIEELKDAIYDANDVLDEFVTLVKQRKAVIETHNKLSKKVRSLLSRFNRSTRNLSRKVKDVNEKLDAIASDSSKFLFKVDKQPKRFIKPESSSFVSKNDIIGRNEDLEKVVGMLLNSDDVDQPNNLSCLAIVGIGGLGKTAFAQLVYNDPRVSSAFDLKSWTCIADQDEWNLTELLGKIVKELFKSNTHDITSLEQMQLELRKQLGGKKYLLVLDDVWTESYHKWQDLEKYLRVGESGSRIVVTTRSKKTAQIVGDVQVHELQGLPEEGSWRLFERMAFLPRQRENPEDDLVILGKEIVKKCKNVPLAIRVVGSLLYGEPRHKWLSFRDKELANISESDDTMNNILRLSYHQLDYPLKSCFSYCAIFPKDFVIKKKMLISLWMAQGYIRTEYVGEEYCLILLQRCFFQDIEVDEWGEIEYFKTHDLLHDIAEQVAEKDICRLSSDSLNVGSKFRHLSFSYDFCLPETFNKAHIRSCLKVCKTWDQCDFGKLLEGNSLSNWTCLRSLDLSNSGAKSFPESIGELFHLRYLNLSRCGMLDKLPDSVTKLVNLQTLDLSNCSHLQELPDNVSKLLDLSTLNITSCYMLSYMPSGMSLLTHLHTLGLFVVGQKSSKGNQCFAGLEGLRSMSNLKGFLEVRILVHDNLNIEEGQGERAYLRNKEHLKKIHLKFTGRKYNILEFKQGKAYKNIEHEQVLLEEMQPHHDLKELKLEGYMGEIMPKWPKEDNLALFHLPSLVTLNISNCILLRCLTLLGKLPRLKYLTLNTLLSVEYVVNVKPEELGLGEESSLFPCLEVLEISDLPKLIGWWPTMGSGVQNKHLIVSKPLSCFTRLSILRICGCPILTSFPVCKSLGWGSTDNDLEAIVGDSVDEFRRLIQTLVPSDSKSRIVSIGDSESESETDSSIDTELTTALNRWMSTYGYTSLLDLNMWLQFGLNPI
ncbi:putative disease resistance protein RGA1 [Silene latifolia]|uniref:putative disease resistance protein RGA1 n=1 Tax=Silene latifolia TaxID=37657 RepID=UPI003D76C967